MGHPKGPAHPAVQAVITEVISRCNAAGIAAGITAGSHADAQAEASRGARMLLVTVQGLLLTGARSWLGEPVQG